MNVYAKIAVIRRKIKDSNLKKSGYNKFSNFNYYELQDFLPTLIDLEQEIAITSLFDELDIANDVARLLVINVEDGTSHVFKTSIKEANVKGMLDIQQLGSQHTYLKRYLYLNYLNLTENDGIDSLDQKTQKEEVKKVDPAKETEQPKLATPNQIKMIESLYNGDVDKLYKLAEHLKVKSLTELTQAQAQDIIKKIKDKQALQQ